MPGVINAGTIGEYVDPDGRDWTYFQDTDTPRVFYIIQRPGFKMNNGIPVFSITEYVTEDGEFLSALCQISTALESPPETVKTAIADALRAKGVTDPTYEAMPYASLGSGPEQNWAHLNYADETGTISGTASAIPSLTGDQQAIFNLENLTQSELDFFKAYFSGVAGAGTVEVNYRLTVIAHMDGVTARIQFDSSKAFEYQRTFKWVS